MNQAHLHLLINHLPVFGSILGAIVLGYGLKTRSENTLRAAFFVLVISSIGGVVAYLTGEPAEHAVKPVQGISKPMIEEHEDAAIFALWTMVITGVLSLAGIYLSYQASAKTRTVSIITLIVALFSFSVVARTAYLGGLIRHTEVTSQAAAVQDQAGGEEDDD